MMWDGGFGMGGGWIFGSIVIFVALALIVVGIVLLVRGLSGRQAYGRAGGDGQAPSGQSPGPSSAMQILEDRYARGEIEKEEFLTRRQDLLGR